MAFSKKLDNLPFVNFDLQSKKSRSIQFLQITNHKLQMANYQCFAVSDSI